MKLCLNLCEILDPKTFRHHEVEEIVQEALKNRKEDRPERIYLGSSFCSQYFLNTIEKIDKVLEYAEANDIPITLTVPIFSQKDLAQAKEVISDLLEKYPVIDEVTVNDLGMLSFFQNRGEKKINLGRLFFKDARDIRVTGHYDGETGISSTLSLLENYGEFSGIELDQITVHPDYSEVPESVEVFSLHQPYTYMTTGNICKFASIHKDDEHKFRPNAKCGLECCTIHEYFTETFKNSDQVRELFRLGRTVYFGNDSINIKGREPDRLIYFPLKELALFG